MRIIENQPINTAVWFLDSDVTGRHQQLIDSDVSLGSERPEETAEIQATVFHPGRPSHGHVTSAQWINHF